MIKLVRLEILEHLWLFWLTSCQIVSIVVTGSLDVSHLSIHRLASICSCSHSIIISHCLCSRGASFGLIRTMLMLCLFFSCSVTIIHQHFIQTDGCFYLCICVITSFQQFALYFIVWSHLVFWGFSTIVEWLWPVGFWSMCSFSTTSSLVLLALVLLFGVIVYNYFVKNGQCFQFNYRVSLQDHNRVTPQLVGSWLRDYNRVTPQLVGSWFCAKHRTLQCH